MKKRFFSAAALLVLAVCVPSSPGWAGAGPYVAIGREDFFVSSDPGIRIFVREVRRSGAKTSGFPILLIHGARVPGLASFDLDVPGGSLAGDLAQAGYVVYIMDARGFGRSTRPPQMSAPRLENPPLVHSDEVVRDIDAVVGAIRKRLAVERIALFGWATGGFWAGDYASLHSDRVSRLIILNSLYTCGSEHPSLGHGSDLEDPKRPGEFNRSASGAYTYNTAESLFRAWNRSMLIEDKSQWRDPQIASAYEKAALASDPESSSQTPPAFRAPAGPLEDSFYVASGRQLWDAATIHVSVLIFRSENDFWSRPADPECMAKAMSGAPQVRIVVIPGATHFVHLDRPERGRGVLLRGLLEFLEPASR